METKITNDPVVKISILILAVALMLCGFFMQQWQNPLKVPIVKPIKLLDIGRGHPKTSFLCPDGLSYSLLFAFPQTAAPTNQNSGETILTQNQTNILRFTVSSAMIHCNWLNQYGLDGFIFPQYSASASNGPTLSSYLKGGVRYEIAAESAPVGASIWLVYRYPSGWDIPLIGSRRPTLRDLPSGK